MLKIKVKKPCGYIRIYDPFKPFLNGSMDLGTSSVIDVYTACVLCSGYFAAKNVHAVITCVYMISVDVTITWTQYKHFIAPMCSRCNDECHRLRTCQNVSDIYNPAEIKMGCVEKKQVWRPTKERSVYV